MPLAYAPEEVKDRLNSVLAHGDKAKVIDRTRINSTLVKEMFNPECDRNNQFSNVLEIFAAIYDIDPERGDLMMQAFVDMYESSKMRHSVELSVDEEAAKLAANANGVALGRLSGAPDYDTLIEAMKVERQAGQTKKAILQNIANRELELMSPPNIIPGVRVQVREFINRRKN